ncbi:MAG: Gfo/Idh/MocA family protein, partial [bacterium]
ILNYPDEETSRKIVLRPRAPSLISRTKGAGEKIGVGLLGAGNFAKAMLVPSLKKTQGFHLRSICSAGGLSAMATAEKAGFDIATSDEDVLFQDESVDAIFVLTRHNEHARQVAKALRAGKAVFTEKPLCLNPEELAEIDEILLKLGPDAPPLTVGFNRRFSPAALAVKAFFSDVQAPLTVSIRFNAGAIPPEHWTQDEQTGGGRLIGEACHAIDLATFLVGSLPIRVFAESIGGPDAPTVTDDQCFITIRHSNGSLSQTAYLAGGDKSSPKERVEVIGGGKIAVIDDFKTWTLTSKGRTTEGGGSQDKGHKAEIAAFAAVLAGQPAASIGWEELRSVTLASILAVRSIREGMPFHLDA